MCTNTRHVYDRCGGVVFLSRDLQQRQEGVGEKIRSFYVDGDTALVNYGVSFSDRHPGGAASGVVDKDV